ncbi:MAG TPA: hypothetical protein VLD65_13090 [Anaerolineales bacterium]|nr:hypothetical protein [Anaerolineales bacterium]
MGVIDMDMALDFMDRGYPDYIVTLYVYCDQCGSFNVSRYLNFKRWFVIGASGVLIILAGVIAVVRPIVSLLWLILLPIFCIIILRSLWGSDRDDDYKCRKCGRVSRANYNTLNLSRENAKIDVPDRLIQKRHWGFGGPESYSINFDDVLKPPEALERLTGGQLLRQLAHDFLVILSLPLMIIGMMIFGVLILLFMIVGAVWVDILSKPFDKIFPRTHGH